MQGNDRLKVLVIDDDADVREMLVRMLETVGCEATPAADGFEAVAAFLREDFDLITLDNCMPELKGTDVLEILRQEFGAAREATSSEPWSLPPVIVITGFASDVCLQREHMRGTVIGVLQKPVWLADLRRTIEDYVGRGVQDEAAHPHTR
jgi:CheY-like chemotaxis protein